jgi:hypothetical protein
LFDVRVWAVPSVVPEDQLPRASNDHDWLWLADPVSPVLVPLSVPRWNDVSWLRPS